MESSTLAERLAALPELIKSLVEYIRAVFGSPWKVEKSEDSKNGRFLNAHPLREPMMVASLLLRYSTLFAKAEMYFCLVMTTPQGTGAPMNLCPLTLTLPMGFLKVTIGALLTNGICRHFQV